MSIIPHASSQKPQQLLQHLRQNSISINGGNYTQNQWQNSNARTTDIEGNYLSLMDGNGSRSSKQRNEEVYRSINADRDSKIKDSRLNSNFPASSDTNNITASSNSAYGSSTPVPNILQPLPAGVGRNPLPHNNHHQPSQSPSLGVYKHFLPQSRDFQHVLAKSKEPKHHHHHLIADHLLQYDSMTGQTSTQRMSAAPNSTNIYLMSDNITMDASLISALQGQSEKMKQASYFSNHSHSNAGTLSANAHAKHQQMGQFTLPQIKAINKNESSIKSPQRFDSFQQADIAFDSNMANTVVLNQYPQSIGPLSQKQMLYQNDQQVLLELEQRFSQKRASHNNFQNQKGGAVAINELQSFTDDLINKNGPPKILTSNGTAIINPSQQQQYMILLNGAAGGLSVNGCKHDILLQEGKQRKNIPGLSNEKTRHQMKSHSIHLGTSNNDTSSKTTQQMMSQPQAFLDLLQAPVNNPMQAAKRHQAYHSVGSTQNFLSNNQRSGEYTTADQPNYNGGNPFVQVSAMIIPNQQPHTCSNMRHKINVQVNDKEEPTTRSNNKLTHSNTSRILDSSILTQGEEISASQFNTITAGTQLQHQITKVTNHSLMSKEWTPNRINNQFSNPYGGVDVLPKTTNTTQIQEFLSPKLLYKKKKREYYQSSQNKTNLAPLSQQQKAKEALASPKVGAKNSNLNQVITQLLTKNGLQHISFVQAIKNINSTQNGSGTTQETIEALAKTAIGDSASSVASKQSLHSMTKSLSQEALDGLEVQHITLQRLGSQKQDGKIQTPFQVQQTQEPSIEQNQTQIQQQVATLNFKTLNKNGPSGQSTGRMLTANELYELAKQIKYKQHYAIQARRLHQSPTLSFTVAGAPSDGVMRKSPRNGNPEGNLQEAINVIKLKEKKQEERGAGAVSSQSRHIPSQLQVGSEQTVQTNTGASQSKRNSIAPPSSITNGIIGTSAALNQGSDPVQPGKPNAGGGLCNHHSQYKLDANYVMNGGGSPDQRKQGPPFFNKDNLGFIIRYQKRNHEVQSCYEELPISYSVGNPLSMRETTISQLDTTGNQNNRANLQSMSQATKQRLQFLENQLQTLDQRIEFESNPNASGLRSKALINHSLNNYQSQMQHTHVVPDATQAIPGHQIFNHYVNNQVFQQSKILPVSTSPQILISHLNQQIQQQQQQQNCQSCRACQIEAAIAAGLPINYEAIELDNGENSFIYQQQMNMINEQEELAHESGNGTVMQAAPSQQALPQQNIMNKPARGVPRKFKQQQQLAKISKIADLEKLLYSQPGFEDYVPNMNPGGGGRVVNRGQKDVQAANGQITDNSIGAYSGVTQPLKKILEPQVSDNENAEFQDHIINKTIKMMTIMNALMYKVNMTKGDQNPVQSELLSRCARYFSFQIPKMFRNDLPGLMKQKDFLSLVKEKMQAALITHINKTNGITEQMIAVNQSQGQYKYYIGGGNNHMLVKSVFKQRSWWIQNEKENFEECNFIWTQWLKERHIKALPKFEKEGSNQEAKYALANGQDPMEQETQSQLPPAIRIYNKIQSNQCLSDKKHLFFNMRDLYLSEGKDPFLVLPLTYVIDDGMNDIEWDNFEMTFNTIKEQIDSAKAIQVKSVSTENITQSTVAIPQPSQLPSTQGQQQLQSNIWIIKPGENTNRGCGIIVSRDFQEIKQIVRDKSSRQDKTAILQKYIENPLLINKRKFDIRCYGLLCSINGHMLGFFYQDGYLRTSCKEFNCQNLSNRYIHLTNDAVQKNSEDYGKFENANKLSFQDFDKYFVENPVADYDLRFQRDFLPQIRTLVRDTFRAVESKIDPERKTNTFEIFGYDFMITDDLKIKLIEVNTNPCLEVCCPLLARIIPNMLDSVFRVTLDPLFQVPPNRRTFSGADVLNDLKMDLVFESHYESSKRKGVLANQKE